MNGVYQEASIANKVTGPAESIDNEICIYSGTSGKIIKNSGIILNYANRNFNIGAGNDIADPSATNYKTASGINISDGSTRGRISGSRIIIFAGLTNMNVRGDNVTIGQWMRSMCIQGNDVTGTNGALVSNAGEGAWFGNLIVGNNWRQTILGHGGRADGVSDTVWGWGARTNGTGVGHRIAGGRATQAVTEGAGVFGSHTNNNWWFGNSEVHKFVNFAGDIENVVPSTRTIILHAGADAWDIQPVPDAFNIAGGPGGIALAGVPTGNGARAKGYFYQADGVNLGQNTKQALQSVGYVDTTGDLVWWDQMRINKISSTAVCLVEASVTVGNIPTDYTVKISNGQSQFNSKGGTSLLLKIANVTRVDVNANRVDFDVPVGLKSYVVASLPTVTTAGQLIYVSNESGGSIPAFSDGVNWRRVTDRAIVS